MLPALHKLNMIMKSISHQLTVLIVRGKVVSLSPWSSLRSLETVHAWNILTQDAQISENDRKSGCHKKGELEKYRSHRCHRYSKDNNPTTTVVLVTCPFIAVKLRMRAAPNRTKGHSTFTDHNNKNNALIHVDGSITH